MRDVMIDIIFVVGFLTVIAVLLAIIFWMYFVCREFIMENKRVFSYIFNREFDKKINDLTEEDFNKWVDGLKKRIAKKRIEDTVVEKVLFDK
jgi:hypothetical protein